jgi:hypothetical protein
MLGPMFLVTPVSNQTAAEMRAFFTLRTLADINDTYAKASIFYHRLDKNSFRPCTWCTGSGHTMEQCYAKDPENLTKYPHSQWINGQPPQHLRRRYCKKHTQEEAQNLTKGITRSAPPAHHHNHYRPSSAWTPTTINPAVPPDPFHLDREQASTFISQSSPSPKEENLVSKPTPRRDWLSGISWRRNWFS